MIITKNKMVLLKNNNMMFLAMTVKVRTLAVRKNRIRNLRFKKKSKVRSRIQNLEMMIHLLNKKMSLFLMIILMSMVVEVKLFRRMFQLKAVKK